MITFLRNLEKEINLGEQREYFKIFDNQINHAKIFILFNCRGNDDFFEDID